MTELTSLIAKYITRDTHSGSVNRIRQLMETELEALIVRSRNSQFRGVVMQDKHIDELKKDFDAGDYARLKKMELQGFEDYKEMRNAPKLSAEAVVAFINQLSPWNLKATGLSVLEAYITTEQLAIWKKALELVGKTETVPKNFEKLLPDRQRQMDYKSCMWARNDVRKELRSAIQQQIDSIKQEDKDNG